MASTDIKWFSFDNLNAPQLSNAWGCMIDVLDACLVTGFGSQAVASIIISNGVGIASFNSAHSIKQFQVVKFSGADASGLNSEFKVLGLTPNTIEFIIDLPDQTATGAISCILAPLGWEKKFSGVQKAIYQAKDVLANPYFLRVDNSRDPVYLDHYAKFAKVGILESCNGIDDFSGNQVPYDPSSPLRNWVGSGSGASAVNGWAKWYSAISEYASSSQISESSVPADGEKEWVLVGNGDSFYICSTPINSTNQESVKAVSSYLYGFGVSEKKNFRVPFLLAHQRYVRAEESEFFFNSNPLRYGWAGSTITMTSNIGVNQQDLAAYPQYYLPGKTGDQTWMLSGVYVFTNPEAGVYFSKIMMHSSGNSFLGSYPLLNSVQSSASNFLDTQTFSEENECFLLKKLAQANAAGAFVFKVGDL